MSTGVFAMKIPLSPPITNIETNAIACNIGVVNLIEPLNIVPNQLNVLIADGTAISMVVVMKNAPMPGRIPLWNMWCPQTTHPKNAIAIIA